ncbi:hypothetical protein INT48_003655 [Thamnidium elegans]|uniref:Uncharacterized protein n=1 Tax=Thamnidium elegans TaxID=101142 RepID=A0A8H7SNI9_9FUNG|nr:hypothetical protein INT48_003655 [Thamnidium elegans]
MEKSNKKEYVAVPTSDVEEAALPAYEETNPAEKSQKRRRNIGFLLIGGAIALLGLTHVCSRNRNYDFEDSTISYLPECEPNALRHIEQYVELKQHMDMLSESFADSDPCERPQHSQFRPLLVSTDDDTPPPPPPPHSPHYGHHREHHHKDHKKHKHHKHHKGKKHHNEPVPPPPPNPFSNSEPSVMGHKKKKHHDHPHKPFCNIKELEATSTVFKFSPEDFQRAGIFLNGYFSRGGHVRLIKSTDESISDVKVNVTLYAGRQGLAKEVKLSAFDHEGQYAVQIERGHFKGPGGPGSPHGPHGPEDDNDNREDLKKGHHHHDKEDGKQENCLVYNVDIEFPANTAYFEDIELHIKAAQRIEGSKSLEGISFGSVKAGLGHGAIIFDGLKAKKLMLGVLNGVVMGTYQPSESFSAGVVRGASKVNIEPTGENVNITASSTFGPASVDIPADKYKGQFALFNLFGESSTITAPNPEDIHVTKYRPTLKAGYYKEENEGSRIVVAAKLHGGEYINFN